MKEAFAKLTVDLHITKCGISGPPGTGKSHIKALILGLPRPAKRRSTALSTKAKEVTTANDIINAGEPKSGSLKKMDCSKERTLGKIVSKHNLQFHSWKWHCQAETIDVSLEDDLEEEEGFSDLSARTYALLKEMYQENKPKKRNTMNNIHLIYFVDCGGQPQFQEILPHFVRSSINFLTHKLSQTLDTCPQFEYCIDDE